MTEQAVGHVRLGWRESFVWRRLAVTMTMSLLSIAAGLALGSGPLVLVAMALGPFPWPVRITVEAHGVRLRWLFLHEELGAEEIASSRLVKDERRWAWPRRSILVLERRGKPALHVFARERVLRRLAAAVARLHERERV